MVFLILEILIFLVLALLLGTLLGFLLSRSMVSDVRTNVEQLKLDVAANRKRLGTAETDLQLHKSALNELRAAYDGLQERLSVHSDRQADLSGQMEGLVAARSALSERTAALASQLTEAQAGLGRQLESAQQSIYGRVDDLSGDRDNLVQRVSALEYVSERLSTSKGSRPALPARPDNAASGEIDARLKVVEEQIQLVGQDGVGIDLTQINGLQKRIDGLAEADNALSSRITALDENQQDVETRVQALEPLPLQVESTRTQVERIQSATTALTSRMEHQDRWGQDAEDRIGALENQLSGPGGQNPGAPGAPAAPAAPPAAANEPLAAPSAPIAAASHDRPNDNLKRLKGVGVAVEKTLNKAGIRHFAQIAAWTHDDIQRLSGPLEKYQSRILRDDWISQAKALMAESGEDVSKGKKAKQPEITPTI